MVYLSRTAPRILKWEGTIIGTAPFNGDPCSNQPEVLYIMVNPDNTQVGSSGDQCDEFMVLWTGSGGFPLQILPLPILAGLISMEQFHSW
jgi:hypothetical protein